MTEANKIQVGGDHYKKMPIEHWDLAVIFGWDFFQYQVTKYLMRWRDKNGIQDLEKVAHFAQKYLEIEKLKLKFPSSWQFHMLMEAASKSLADVPRDKVDETLDQAPLDDQRDHAESLRDGDDGIADGASEDQRKLQELLSVIERRVDETEGKGGNLSGVGHLTKAGRQLFGMDARATATSSVDWNAARSRVEALDPGEHSSAATPRADSQQPRGKRPRAR